MSDYLCAGSLDVGDAPASKGGNVAFEDDSSTKILGEGVVEHGIKNVK
jgi:hypothetical protein